VGGDVGSGLRRLFLWLLFNILLSIEGKVNIASIRRKGVDLWATFFGDKVYKSDTSLANVVPSTSEALKAMGRDIQSLCDGRLGRILLGWSKDESQG